MKLALVLCLFLVGCALLQRDQPRAEPTDYSWLVGTYSDGRTFIVPDRIVYGGNVCFCLGARIGEEGEDYVTYYVKYVEAWPDSAGTTR